MQLGKIVEWSWGVTLRRGVEDVRTVLVFLRYVGSHLLHKDLYEFKVSMVARKMDRTKQLVGGLICPFLQGLSRGLFIDTKRQIVFTAVCVQYLEARRMVFECAVGQGSVLSRLLHFNDVDKGTLLLEQTFQLVPPVLSDELEHLKLPFVFKIETTTRCDRLSLSPVRAELRIIQVIIDTIHGGDVVRRRVIVDIYPLIP